MRARWYDPGTGQFLSVDPDLAETAQPYTYAGDDPVNMRDPSGNLTVGYCAGLFGALLGPQTSGAACLTRVVSGGPDEIGVVGTWANGGPNLMIAGGVMVAEEISTATEIGQLRGPFAYFQVSLQDDEGQGGSVVVFTGTTSSNKWIFGIDVEAGVALWAPKTFPLSPVIMGGGWEVSGVTVFNDWWQRLGADLMWDGMGLAFGEPPVQDALTLAEWVIQYEENRGPRDRNRPGTTRWLNMRRLGWHYPRRQQPLPGAG
jgi:hypothetical protein